MPASLPFLRCSWRQLPFGFPAGAKIGQVHIMRNRPQGLLYTVAPDYRVKIPSSPLLVLLKWSEVCAVLPSNTRHRYTTGVSRCYRNINFASVVIVVLLFFLFSFSRYVYIYLPWGQSTYAAPATVKSSYTAGDPQGKVVVYQCIVYMTYLVYLLKVITALIVPWLHDSELNCPHRASELSIQ